MLGRRSEEILQVDIRAIMLRCRPTGGLCPEPPDRAKAGDWKSVLIGAAMLGIQRCVWPSGALMETPNASPPTG